MPSKDPNRVQVNSWVKPETAQALRKLAKQHAKTLGEMVDLVVERFQRP